VTSEYLFELGGENKELAKIEARELLKTEGYNPETDFEEGQIVIIKTSQKLALKTIRRLGMTKRVSIIIHSSEEKDIGKVIEQLPTLNLGKSSFAIRQISRNVISERKIAIKIGRKIPIENEIDLDNPEVKILFYTGSRTIISILEENSTTSYKSCLKHHVRYRPYFSPISIHPRIARSMVNLANCSPNNTVLDPFCGTGGILIEAADMGMKAKGIDLLEKMVVNSNGNLEHFGLEGKIMKGDVEESKSQSFEAIVTDPPYGIASSTGGEKISELLQRTMIIFSEAMEKGKRIVLAISNPELIQTTNFKKIYQFEWYIHKSLTRYIMVLEKTNN
jgi:tRNA (guanine10-N2)-dimethyltransferase